MLCEWSRTALCVDERVTQHDGVADERVFNREIALREIRRELVSTVSVTLHVARFASSTMIRCARFKLS